MTTYFGSETRAVDGIIVTFELEDGKIWMEHFWRVPRTKSLRWRRRKTTYDGAPAIDQVVERADQLGAKVLCLSTPSTVLTDLQGSRAKLKAQRTGVEGSKGGMQQAAPNHVGFPEIQMLGKAGRMDLFKRPTGGQNGQNIRQMTQHRPGRRKLFE